MICDDLCTLVILAILFLSFHLFSFALAWQHQSRCCDWLCAGGSARTTKGARGPKGPRTSKGTEGNQGGEDYYDGPLWLVDPFEGTGSIFLDVW